MTTDYNFHTHTTYCDGHDTPRELALAALEKGMRYLGFSGHAHMTFDESYCMSKADTLCYISDILSVRDEFGADLHVFCGIEQDMFSDAPVDGYDFVIGSVHYIKKGGVYYPIDESSEKTRKIIDSLYHGDFLGFARDYYELESRVAETAHADIIGHIDLVMKFSDTLMLTETREYLDIAGAACEKLCKSGALFEINTGAMARGMKKAPYPSGAVLSVIHSLGGRVLLSSDCHDRSRLDYAFDEALSFARASGFKDSDIVTGAEFADSISKAK